MAFHSGQEVNETNVVNGAGCGQRQEYQPGQSSGGGQKVKYFRCYRVIISILSGKTKKLMIFHKNWV